MSPDFSFFLSHSRVPLPLLLYLPVNLLHVPSRYDIIMAEFNVEDLGFSDITATDGWFNGGTLIDASAEE